MHESEEIPAARFLWQPDVYDLVMLDVRRYSPAEALEFYEQIRAADPRQQFAFLMGSPRYLSLTWPTEVVPVEKESQQWAETVRRFVTAA